MLRITRSERDAEIWLKLEGKLMGPWVGECHLACKLGELRTRPTHLDLSGITYVDAEGVGLLRRLRDEGVRFPMCSSFVAELLKGEERT